MDAYRIGNLPGSVAPESATSETTYVASIGRIEAQQKGDSADFRADGIGEQLRADATSRLRSGIKRLIVFSAGWGFPATWAQWLIQTGGLSHD